MDLSFLKKVLKNGEKFSQVCLKFACINKGKKLDEKQWFFTHQMDFALICTGFIGFACNLRILFEMEKNSFGILLINI